MIRAATKEDLPEISELLGQTWHATYDGIYGRERVSSVTAKWHSVANLVAGLDNPSRTFLVAEVNGTIVGTASAAISPDNETVTLARLYVHPHHQGLGLGKAMFAAMIAAYPNAKRLTLEVEPANSKAIGFYQARGLAITGKTKDCGGCGDDIAALVLTKSFA